MRLRMGIMLCPLAAIFVKSIIDEAENIPSFSGKRYRYDTRYLAKTGAKSECQKSITHE